MLLDDACQAIDDVHEFLTAATMDIIQSSKVTKPEGPDETFSLQTIEDIALLAENTRKLCTLMEEHAYSDHFNLHCLTTLYVENFFALMREITDMPTMMELSHRFVNCCREMIKRSSSCGFVYLTSHKAYPQVTSLPFSELPIMPIPEKRTLTSQQQREMRERRIENGKV